MKKGWYFIIIFSLLASCKQAQKKENTTATKIDYTGLGLQYAVNTQKVLGKNLVQTIKNQGVLAAIKFCNIKAYPLTDSMSVAQNVVIKRISDRNRNKKNNVTFEEKSYIRSFENAVLQNKPIQPIVIKNRREVRFYAPIITVPKCLQCHGVIGKEVKPEVYKTIKDLYPEDKAIGYQVNEIRGLWYITFSKKQLHYE